MPTVAKFKKMKSGAGKQAYAKKLAEKRLGAKKAQTLSPKLGRGQNLLTSGPGSQRSQAKYTVRYDAKRKRYVHVYGAGESDSGKRKEVVIRKGNPLTTQYEAKYGNRTLSSGKPNQGSLKNGAKRTASFSKAQTPDVATRLAKRRKKQASFGKKRSSGGATFIGS